MPYNDCYFEGRLQSMVFFLQRVSSFHLRFSSIHGQFSIEGCLPLKVFFHQSLSSIEGRLPSKDVFQHMSSSMDVCHPSKVIFQLRLSFIEDHPPSKKFEKVPNPLPLILKPPLTLAVTGRQTARRTDRKSN